jgi:hypothetical protein
MRLWLVGVGLPLILYGSCLWSFKTKIGYPVLPLVLAILLFLCSAVLRDRNRTANGSRALDWILLFFLVSGMIGVLRVLWRW